MSVSSAGITGKEGDGLASGDGASGDSVLVIGGGVIGGMCAWYLHKAGYRVTVMDQGQFGAACSHGNCGYVCPSHVLPLCQPGAIAKTMKAMLRRNSPFAIKPRASRAWIAWFWNFMRACEGGRMMKTAAGNHALLQSSLELYRDLVKEEEIDCDWQERGLLFVHDNVADFEAYAETDELLREHFGQGATPYAGDDVLSLEPALKPGLGGAWHYEGDCHLRPDMLMAGLRRRLEAGGVQFIEGQAMEGFRREGSTVRAVVSGGESIEASRFIVATGAMTPMLNDHLGFKIPIEPGKGYSITSARTDHMPVHPIIFEDSHVAVTPMSTGFRVGSTMEFVGYNTSIHPRRLGLLTAAAKKYLRGSVPDEVEETWYGWRPMVWDGRPIIDRAPVHDNVWIAAGHSMLGLSMATGTGRLISELVSGDHPHVDPEPYRASRFMSS